LATCFETADEPDPSELHGPWWMPLSMRTLHGSVRVQTFRGGVERGGGGGHGDESDDVPRVIEAHSSRSPSHEAAKDWRKILERLQRQQLNEARMRLAEWETKHGETNETRRLGAQLHAALRAQGRGRTYEED
jgi:hypothetical protein